MTIYILSSLLLSLCILVGFLLLRMQRIRNENYQLLEYLDEGIFLIDERLHICFANAGASKMIGISKRRLIHSLFPSNTPLQQSCLHLLSISRDRGEIMTDSFSTNEGRKLYIDLIAFPRKNGSGFYLILQDKSSHHKVIEMGKDFVSNASHELRTPITIIRGFAETLQDLPEISTEMLCDITEKIVRNCQRMDNLVRNLLTLADIENIDGKHFQECNFSALVEDCAHLLLSLHPEAQVSLDKDSDSLSIPADRDLLELAVMNILENAIKYSPHPASISLAIFEKEEEVQLHIRDKGIGIPAGDLDQIFERFYTVDKAHSRRLGGAGLGLSIVKTIIEKHEGAIDVTSEIGQGSTFTIHLPRSYV